MPSHVELQRKVKPVSACVEKSSIVYVHGIHDRQPITTGPIKIDQDHKLPDIASEASLAGATHLTRHFVETVFFETEASGKKAQREEVEFSRNLVGVTYINPKDVFSLRETKDKVIERRNKRKERSRAFRKIPLIGKIISYLNEVDFKTFGIESYIKKAENSGVNRVVFDSKNQFYEMRPGDKVIYTSPRDNA